jgi:hypothetical protein
MKPLSENGFYPLPRSRQCFEVFARILTVAEHSPKTVTHAASRNSGGNLVFVASLGCFSGAAHVWIFAQNRQNVNKNQQEKTACTTR